jgi:hypothetical protein
MTQARTPSACKNCQIMRFKLFRKSSDSRARFQQDSSLAEALARRVSGIEFQPSKGFLKDQQQPKLSTASRVRKAYSS